MPSPIYVDATNPADVTMVVDGDMLQTLPPELAANELGEVAGTLIANLIDAAKQPPAADWLNNLRAHGCRVRVTIEAL
jgi:hypothetical protein